MFGDSKIDDIFSVMQCILVVEVKKVANVEWILG